MSGVGRRASRSLPVTLQAAALVIAAVTVLAAGCDPGPVSPPLPPPTGTLAPGGMEGEARYRAAMEALEAQATMEAMATRLGEMARQATAVAEAARREAGRATAVAEMTREARESTRQALEILATRQALEAGATRQALEAQATATAQAFWLEATRTALEATRSWEATRTALEATAEARGWAPTATAEARAQVAEERAWWWETQVRIPAWALAQALLPVAAGLLLLVVAGRGLIRLFDAVVLRARVIRGQNGQVFVILEDRRLQALPPIPPPAGGSLPPPPPSPVEPADPSGIPIRVVDGPLPDTLERLVRRAEEQTAFGEIGEDTRGEDDLPSTHSWRGG